MRRDRLGETGVELSAIGLGGVWFRADDAAGAHSVLAASFDAGVNWVDTAEGYGDGDNEIAIGEALRSIPEMMVASKISPWRTGLGHEDVRLACRASLQRLQRDVLDVYFVHHPDGRVPLEETWGGMTELVQQGLVRAIGLSNFSTGGVRRAHACRPVDVVQDGLSLVDYLGSRQHFEACADLGIPAVAFEAVVGGLLAGAITAETDVSPLREWGPLFDRVFAPGRLERSLAVADRLRELAADWDSTMAQLAIAWCLHQVGVASVLAGTKNIEHTLANARAADIVLDEAQLATLDDLIPLGPSFS